MNTAAMVPALPGGKTSKELSGSVVSALVQEGIECAGELWCIQAEA